MMEEQENHLAELKCELCNKEDFTLIVDEKKICIKCYDKWYRTKDYKD